MERQSYVGSGFHELYLLGNIFLPVQQEKIVAWQVRRLFNSRLPCIYLECNGNLVWHGADLLYRYSYKLVVWFTGDSWGYTPRKIEERLWSYTGEFSHTNGAASTWSYKQFGI